MNTLKAENGEVLEVKEAIVLNSENKPIPNLRSSRTHRFTGGTETPHVRVFKINGLLGLIFPILFFVSTLIFIFALGGSLFTILLVGWAVLSLIRGLSRVLRF